MSQNQLLVSRARAAVIARDFTLAARLYKQLLRDDRDNIQLLNQLGELYMKSGKDDQALPLYKRISELDSANSKPLITMGGIYRRLEKYDESIAVLEQALVLDGTNAQISYNLGFTYKFMGDFENAISCFEDAIEMNPEDVLAYNHLGAIYAMMDEQEKAIQTYQRGLNVDANHPVLLFNIAKSYEAVGEYEKACTSYSGALRSKPLWVDAIDGYARLLISLKRAKDAYAMVNRALAVNQKEQSLVDALINIKKYMEEETGEISPAGEEESDVSVKPEEIPSVFENAPAYDDSDFDTNGLEISMDDNREQFSEIEDLDLENLDANMDAGLTDSNDKESPFSFDSMGMDDLAGDGPLDHLFFEEQSFEPEAPGEMPKNLDDLITNTEAPFDTEELPVSDNDVFKDDDSVFSDFVPEIDSNEITMLDDDVKTQVETPEMQESVLYNKEDVEDMTEELSQQIEKAEELLEKANMAAEKAWDAAQKAADSAQYIEAVQNSMEEEADQDTEMDTDTEVESQTDEALASLEENETPDPKLSMFLRLRELIEFLPQDKKEEFMSSRMRLMLDYVISRLQGQQGLFEKVSGLIEEGSVQPWEGNSDEDRNILAEGIVVLKQLAQEVSDESLKNAMNSELSKIL